MIKAFYQVRLKNWPDRFINKKDKTYALYTDHDIQTRINFYVKKGNPLANVSDVIQFDAHWFANELKAEVFTEPKYIYSLMSRARNCPIGGNVSLHGTFSQYEVVKYGTEDRVEIIPLDDFNE